MLLALVLDAGFGEPPEPVHPVVWMGRGLAWLEAHAPASVGSDLPHGCACGASSPCAPAYSSWRGAVRLGYGAASVFASVLAWACVAWLVERLAPWPLQALALKPTFAGRGLLQAAARVEGSLRASQLVEARHGLRSLVSRPTSELSPSLVAAAAIESLAENLVDSWVAPLLAYACFGLPGAYVYRAANTADAMWGYRTQRYEQLGKLAARLDDGLSAVPARLGALLLVLVGPHPRTALAIWRRDAGRTPSPNAGHPMAAAAGQLEVRLEKPGVYVLNPGAAEPTCEHIAVARRLVARAMLAAGLLALAGRATRTRHVPAHV